MISRERSPHGFEIVEHTADVGIRGWGRDLPELFAAMARGLFSIVTEVEAAVPPLEPEPDSPAEALVRLLTGANQTHVVSYCTEGGLFQRAGLSTVICGPGSIDQAHRPDEFIETSQIAACEDFVRRLIDWAATA